MADTTIEFTSPLAEQPFLIYVGSYFQIIPNVAINNAVGSTVYKMLSGSGGTGLPPGLNIDPTTGIISGIPTNYTMTGLFVTIRATNNGIYADRRILLIFGQLATTLNWKSPTAGNFGTANGGSYFKFVSVTSVVNPYGPTTYSLLSGILPAGTTLNPSNGEITGTLVNSTSTYLFEIRATNNGVNADRTFYGNVKAQTIVKWNSPASGYLGSWVAGSSFSLVSDVSVENGVGSTTYSISSGKLPVGIRLDLANGIISGTLPNLATNYRFTVRATNNGVTADRLFNFVVNTTPTSINWNGPASDLGTLEGGLPFNFTADVTVTNPVGATTYALVSGKLPTGTILDKSKGIISGTLPNIPSTYSFTISANNNGKTEIRAFYTTIVNSTTVTWNGPASDLGILEGGSPFNFTADTTVTNGVGTTTYSLLTGAGYGPLPAGTILNPNTGVITGTVANSNSAYSFTIRATNNGIAADRIFTGTIAAKITSIVWGPESNLGNFAGESSFNFSANTTVTNGVGATTYSLVPNYTLPAGLILNPTSGTIAGTVSKISGQYEFRLRATNNGVSADQPFTFTVIGETVVTLTSPSNPEIGGWTTGSSVIINLSADVINPVGATTFSIDLGPQINDTYGQVGTLSGANNIISSNEFPPGLFLNASTGIISGIMTNPLGYSTGYPFLHRYFFALRATNNGISDATIFWIDLLPTIPVTSIVWNGPASDLGPWNGGTSFNFVPDVTVTNGVGETTYSLVAVDGPLPAGTILDPVTGIITGTLENTTANYSFTIRATNNGVSANRTFNTSVTTVVLETTIIWRGPASELGTLYSGTPFNFTADTVVTNGVGPTTYRQIIQAPSFDVPPTEDMYDYGPLPDGVRLDPATGIIYGILSNSSYSGMFTIEATNNEKSARKKFHVIVIDTSTDVTWNSPESDLGKLVGGAAFDFVSNTSVTNGVGSTTYSLVTGAGYGPLPSGTNLSLDGRITGTLPNATANYSFTIRATNNGATADRNFTASVDGVTVVTWNAPESDLGKLAGGSAFNFISNTSVINGIGETTYSLVTGPGYGPLPAGTNLNSAGRITGTLPNTTADYSFTIRATNNGATADRNFTTSVGGVTIVTWNSPESDLGPLTGGTAFNFISNTSVINGVGETTYSLVTGLGYGPLPAGTILNSDGRITGTLSNITANYAFTIRATNNGATADRNFTTSVTGETVVTWNAPESDLGKLAGGSAFNFISNTSVTNGVGSTTYSLVTGLGYGPLPSGTNLSLDGRITGTLTNTPTDYSFTIRATNNGVWSDRTFSASVTGETIVTWHAPFSDLGPLTGGTAFNFISNTSVINGVGETTYSLVTGAGYGPLPSGTNLSLDGRITGTLPNITANYAFTIRATNNGATADRNFTASVTGETIVTWIKPESDLGKLVGGAAFDFVSNTSVTNGVGSTTYSLVTGPGYGPLPAGTNLSLDGRITGTLPNTTANYAFTIRATNNGAKADRNFTTSVTGVTIVNWVNPPAGNMGTLAGGSAFNFVSETRVTNGVGATTYSLVTGVGYGDLPAGTNLSLDGRITGTLTNKAGSYSFTIRATNNGQSDTRTFILSVKDTNTYVKWILPNPGNYGSFNCETYFNFESKVDVINPVGATTYSLVTGVGYGPLPAGTKLDPVTGIISGVLTTYNVNYTYPFTIRATNNGVKADRDFSATIIGKPTSIVWNGPASDLGTLKGGDAFNFISNTSVTNGVGETTYSLVTGVGYGPLPAGTILNSDGRITGTLTNISQNFLFTLRATNNGVSANRQFSGKVVGQVTSVTWVRPTDRQIIVVDGGSEFNFESNTTVINPVGATTYALVSGPLPAGTKLEPTNGIISGKLDTPNTAYIDYPLTLSATNNGVSANRIWSVRVLGTSVKWLGPPEGRLSSSNGGSEFSLISVTETIRPVGATTYSIFSGSLPAGTKLDPITGIISGKLDTPKSAYIDYSFTIRATNNGVSANRSWAVYVLGTSVTWVSPTAGQLANIDGGSEFNFESNTTVINPVGATTYALVSGPLPAGTTLNTANGVISGTLNTPKVGAINYPFTLSVTNNGVSVNRSWAVYVLGTSVTWVSPTAGQLANINGGSEFNFESNTTVINPVGATTYALVSGPLPAGTTLNTANGVISGTLNTPKVGAINYPFTLSATNNGVSVNRSWAVYVLGTSVTWVSPTAGRLALSKGGSEFNFISNTTVVNPVGATTYALVSGPLPAGTTLNTANGVISGTLNTPKGGAIDYPFTLSATNNGVSVNRSWSVYVLGTSIKWVSPLEGDYGTFNGGSAFTLASNTEVVSPVGPTIYTVFSGTLPAGTRLDANTGAITGTLVTPKTASAPYNFILAATNNGVSANRSFFGRIAGTSITWDSPATNLGELNIGSQFSFNAKTTVVNPVGETTYALAIGTGYGPLPEGTRLDPATGAITGTLSNKASTYSFTIIASNNGVSSPRTFTGSIIGTSIKWVSPDPTLATLTGGDAFNFTAITTVTNPVGATTYELVPVIPGYPQYGPLPAGTRLDANTGAITGTLATYQANYNYGFTIIAKNNGVSAYRSFSGTVIGKPTSIRWDSPVEGNYGTFNGGDAFNLECKTTVINGVGTTKYTLEYNNYLPDGTNLDANTGVISGQLTLNSSTKPYSFTIRATNNGVSALRKFSLTVIGSSIKWVSPDPTLATFNGGDAFNFTAVTTAVNPSGSTTYELLNYNMPTSGYGPLPAGTNLDPVTGIISGTLATYQTNYNYGFTIKAKNKVTSENRTFTGTVIGKPTSIRWDSPAEGNYGTFKIGDIFNMSSVTTVVNPVGTTKYYLVSGSLPTGTNLNLDSGVINGTLTNSPTYTTTFIIAAINNGKRADRAFTVIVMGTSIKWESPDSDLGKYTGGDIFNMPSVTTVVNPVGTTKYYLVSGSLPTGTNLNLDSGVVFGTLTTYQADYTKSFTIAAINNGKRADRAFTITIIGKPTSIRWVSPDEGYYGTFKGGDVLNFVSITDTINPVGTTKYQIVAGGLPLGINLDVNSGIMSGKFPIYQPDYVYSFTIAATNNGKSVNRAFSINLTGTGTTTTTPTGTTTTVIWTKDPIFPDNFVFTKVANTYYGLQPNITLTNQVGKTVYSLVGSLPAGLTLVDPYNYTGSIITGAFTTLGPQSFTVKVTNNGVSANKTFYYNVTAR